MSLSTAGFVTGVRLRGERGVSRRPGIVLDQPKQTARLLRLVSQDRESSARIPGLRPTQVSAEIAPKPLPGSRAKRHEAGRGVSCGWVAARRPPEACVRLSDMSYFSGQVRSGSYNLRGRHVRAAPGPVRGADSKLKGRPMLRRTKRTGCAALALALELLMAGCGSSHTHAPTALQHFPADLKLGLSSGIYDDGWVTRQASLELAGGRAAELTLQAEVPPAAGKGQRLQLLVDGRLLIVHKVTPGQLDLHIPVPASTTPRRVALRWAFSSRISAQDSRSAAALLHFIGIAPPPPEPLALRVPTDLSKPGLVTTGLYKDGWLAQHSSLVLAGGKAAELTIRALVLPWKGQHLEVLVNGHGVVSQAAPAGQLELRVPVPASPARRKVELRFAGTVRLKPPDTRQAAALLHFIGVSPQPSLPTAITAPADLAAQGRFTAGVYKDGWLAQHSSLVLAGGKAAELTIRALVPARKSQHLEVLVNGHQVASQAAPAGQLELRVPVPASPARRKVELRFAGTVRLKPPDTRQAAALLHFIGVSPPRPSGSWSPLPAGR
jgi:hypothetical protein